jgi:putative transcriptional regulator
MAKLNITNNIRRLRFENNEMTQQELAEKAGATRQTILALEKGKYNPSLELAFNIALALNTPIEKVFQLEQPEE